MIEHLELLVKRLAYLCRGVGGAASPKMQALTQTALPGAVREISYQPNVR